MDSGNILTVKDRSGTLTIATSTDDRDQATDALAYVPESEERPQEHIATVRTPKTDDEIREAYGANVEQARRLYKDFDQIAFNEKRPLYEGVRSFISQCPKGDLRGVHLQYELGTNPRLARELSEIPVEQAMARAGEIGARLGSREGANRHRKRAFAGISE